jgi:hypothetical protein
MGSFSIPDVSLHYMSRQGRSFQNLKGNSLPHPSTRNTQRSRSTFNTQPSTFNLQRATFNLATSTFNLLQPSTFTPRSEIRHAAYHSIADRQTRTAARSATLAAASKSAANK